MNIVDYTLVALYLGVMIHLGMRFRRSEHGADYFLGGRQFGWFALCMSTMATQLSAISFVSAPAFVGLRPGGGMQWLTFELGVPFAMIIIMASLGPTLRRSGVVSVYTYLESRFGRSSRMLLAALFLISRSFGSGVGLYMIGLVLSTIAGFPFWQTMCVLGLVTIVYSLEGGMKAIVYSEVAQMIIKVLGILAIVFIGLRYVGGWSKFVEQVDHSRLLVIDFTSFGFDGREYGFWPMLIGGIFLYVSYYATDQTQAQRILSAKDEGTVRNLLLYNGLFRFPITLAYCTGGLVLATFAKTDAAFSAKLSAGKPDLLVPVFITDYLPHGVIGLLVIALIAAWMSSYSTTLNSLTAVTMEDFISRWKEIPSERYVLWSKSIALIWGAVTLSLGFVAGKIAPTAIEAINKVSSMFYGPILGIFLLTVLGPAIRPAAANIGVITGVLLNLCLWLFQKQIFWFWWNAIGAFVTVTLGIGLSMLMKRGSPERISLGAFVSVSPGRAGLVLAGYFAGIVAFCYWLPQLF